MSPQSTAVFLDSGTINKGDLDCKGLEKRLEISFFEVTGDQDVVKRAKGSEIIICNKTKINKSHFEQLPGLKYIIVAATGYDNIDLDAAAAQGVKLSNIRDYSTDSVIQQVFALLLAYLNRSQFYFEENRKGAWSGQPFFSYWYHSIEELNNKTLGILGLGSIGKGVAGVALAFGMKVLACHTHPERDKMEGVSFVGFDALLEGADILTLHVPLNDATYQIIDYKALEKMQAHAILVNTARGDLIDESALAEALENEKIQAALLDVLSMEPPPADHILLWQENCFITPHQAWASRQSRERLLDGIIKCVDGYLRGEIINELKS